MKITKKNSKGLKREFNIVISAKEIEDKINEKLSEIALTARIPGFRPGKIPTSILKARIGKEVRGEILQTSIDEASKKAIQDENLKPVMKPSIDIEKYDEGSDLKALLSLEIMPIIKHIDLSKIKLEKFIAKVSDKDVNEALDRIAKQNQQTQPLKKARKSKLGDTLVIDFEGKMNNVAFDGGTGKGHHLALGSNSFIPGFEEGLVGLNANDEKKLKLSFPKDYGMEKLAGKKVTFDVKIHEIREPVPVKYDENFAKNLGMPSMKDLKKAISDQISNEHSNVTRSKLKMQLLDILDKKYKFDLPEGMVEQEYISVCNSLNKNKTETKNVQKENNIKPDEKMTKDEKVDAKNIAQRRVKLGLLMGDIGRNNNIDVSEEEIKQAVMMEAQKYPGQEKQVLEYYEKNKEASQNLAGPLFEEKVFDFICEMSEIKEKTVSVEDLYKEEGEGKKKLTKKQKLAWFLVGLIGGLTGVVIALIAWLISEKKKGQFKFALLGFGAYLIFIGLITFFVFGDNKFVVGFIVFCATVVIGFFALNILRFVRNTIYLFLSK